MGFFRSDPLHSGPFRSGCGWAGSSPVPIGPCHRGCPGFKNQCPGGTKIAVLIRFLVKIAIFQGLFSIFEDNSRFWKMVFFLTDNSPLGPFLGTKNGSGFVPIIPKNSVSSIPF